MSFYILWSPGTHNFCNKQNRFLFASIMWKLLHFLFPSILLISSMINSACCVIVCNPTKSRHVQAFRTCLRNCHHLLDRESCMRNTLCNNLFIFYLFCSRIVYNISESLTKFQCDWARRFGTNKISKWTIDTALIGKFLKYLTNIDIFMRVIEKRNNRNARKKFKKKFIVYILEEIEFLQIFLSRSFFTLQFGKKNFHFREDRTKPTSSRRVSARIKNISRLIFADSNNFIHVIALNCKMNFEKKKKNQSMFPTPWLLTIKSDSLPL